MIWRSSGRLTSEPGRRVDERVQREAEQEEHAVREQQARRQRDSDGANPTPWPEDGRGDPVLEGEDERAPARATIDVLGQPRPARSRRLADHELARRGGADQQLHDPAALLGDDARRDPHPVDHDRDEDQERRTRSRRTAGWRTPARRAAAAVGRRRSTGTTSNGGGLERPTPGSAARVQSRIADAERRRADSC